MLTFFRFSMSSLCRLIVLLLILDTLIVVPARAQSTLDGTRGTRVLAPLSESARWRAQSTLRRIKALGAHTSLRRIQAIRVDGSTLQEASDGPVRRGAPLSFKFSSQFRADQIAAFNAFAKKIYPVLLDVYGPPAPSQQGRTIRIDKQGGAGDGFYDSRKQTISYCPVLDCPVPGDDFTLETARMVDEYNLTRLMLIAFHGPQLFEFDAWEYGFADAAALIATFRAAGKPNNFNPVLYGNYLLPLYDFFNRPEIGGPYFFAEDIQNLGFYRNGMAQAAWLKVYVENDQFFKQFNAAYYPQVAKLQKDAAALEALAARFAPNVELLKFSDWARRQYILDTRITLGDKLWVGINPGQFAFLGIAQAFRTELDVDGYPVEKALNGQVEVRAFDENGLDITDKSANLTRNNRFPLFDGAAETLYGSGDAATDYPAFENIGSPNVGRITLHFRVGNSEASAYFPYNVADNARGINGIYGVVVNSNRGNVKITSAAKASNAPYVRGAFGSSVSYPSAHKVKTLFALQPADGAAPQTLQRNSAWSWNGNASSQIGVVLETAPGNTATTNTWKRAGTNQWRLVSLPLYPAQSDEAKVLGVRADALQLARYRPVLSPASAIEKTAWRFGINGDKHDLYPRLRESLAPGRGFWLRLDRDLTASIRGGEPSRAKPFEVPLTGGWNTIGVPFKTAFALSSLRVRLGSAAPVSFAQAVTNRWIVPGVWRWKIEGGYARVDNGSAANQVLQPFEGYYIFSPIGRGVVLIFDAAHRTGGQSTLVPPTSATFWRVPLSVSAASGREFDGAFGVSSNATFLPAAHPPLGERALSLSFGSSGSTLAEATRAGKESGWAESLVAPFAASATWKFSIDGAQAGETVRLGWGDLRSVPGRLDFLLIDESNGRQTPMLPGGASSYSFVAGSGARSLRIAATVRPAGRVVARALWPSPVVQIEYQANEDETVGVQIETLAGEAVQILKPQFVRRGNTLRWVWDGRDANGRMIFSAGKTQEWQARIVAVGDDELAREQIVRFK